MFGIRSRHGRAHPDPLQTRKAAAEWFRNLPALDVIGRQTHVVEAFAGLRHGHAAYDLDRVAAVLFLDAALEVDRRRLVKWHLENLRGSAKLAERFWHAAHEVAQGFVVTYDDALAVALLRADDRRWQACLPRLAARRIHFDGICSTLRLFRGERLIPARWRQLHALFLRACTLCIERAPTALPGEDPLAQHATVEHEYLHVLLLDLLRTGNLTPAELDWAGVRLHGWSAALALDTQPPATDGFYVDLAGSAGLARHVGAATGSQVGYLDTTPLVVEVERAIAALRGPDANGGTEPDLLARQRISTLERIRPAISPRREADLRREPRVPVDVAADVRVGLAQIAHELAAADAPEAGPRVAPPPAPARPAARVADDDGTEEIELLPVADEPQAGEGIAAMAHAPSVVAPQSQWRLADRSDAGWRISAPGGLGQGLALGALVAVWPADGDGWRIGVVSRLGRGTHREIVAGMSLMAGRVVPVTLYARRRAEAEMSFVVDGTDISTLGARFDGLYLMPPSAIDTRVAMRTLIIPSSEYFEGRSVILSTARSNYAVTLGHVIDQRADWCWVAIRVSAKAPRTQSPGS